MSFSISWTSPTGFTGKGENCFTYYQAVENIKYLNKQHPTIYHYITGPKRFKK
jgi:hypothetical protein